MPDAPMLGKASDCIRLGCNIEIVKREVIRHQITKPWWVDGGCVQSQQALLQSITCKHTYAGTLYTHRSTDSLVESKPAAAPEQK